MSGGRRAPGPGLRPPDRGHQRQHGRDQHQEDQDPDRPAERDAVDQPRDAERQHGQLQDEPERPGLPVRGRRRQQAPLVQAVLQGPHRRRAADLRPDRRGRLQLRDVGDRPLQRVDRPRPGLADLLVAVDPQLAALHQRRDRRVDRPVGAAGQEGQLVDGRRRARLGVVGPQRAARDDPGHDEPDQQDRAEQCDVEDHEIRSGDAPRVVHRPSPLSECAVTVAVRRWLLASAFQPPQPPPPPPPPPQPPPPPPHELPPPLQELPP